ncbi:CRK2 [Symbiodinium sp. KB8]|nr:CRK2 [Symbiodinium sp. KB8]
MSGYDFEESVASSVLDSISLNPALEFVCGRGDVAPQIEAEVQEMKIGERRSLTLDSSNPLFGFYDESRRISVPASEFSTAEIGTVVSLEGYGAGMGLVLERDAQTLLVDQNHPLAGKSVNVTLTLLRCEKVPPRDVRVMSLVGGDGQTFPAYGDWLTLNYELRLAGSTRIIDSSRDVGPLEYHLGFDQARLVPGFEIGVQQMSLGEVASIHVPSQLAYGSKGSDKAIPANADLVYKVALLGIRHLDTQDRPKTRGKSDETEDHGRSLDSPLRAYSPEEEKKRDASSRETCRLRYKAPELILRKEEYGAAVDIWATGCLLAEAVLSTPLFESTEEVDHLFLIFRLLGTPGPGHWPEALRCRHFSPRFPVYKPVDLGALTRATARAAVGDCTEVKLLAQEMEHREDVLQKLCCIAKKLQARGMALLASLLRLDPAQRSTAEQALQSTFFTALSEPDTPSRRRWRTHDGIEAGDVEGRRVRQKSQQSQESPCDMSGPSQVSWKWSQDIPCSQQEMATPGTAVAQTLARCQLFTQSSQGSPVSKRRLCGAMSGDTLWPPLWAEMMRQDAMCRPSASTLPSHTVLRWQQEVDLLLRLGTDMQLMDQTLHLAAALLHDQLSNPDPTLQPTLATLACLKLADAMLEKSHEYFMRDRSGDIRDACNGSWSKKDIVEAEKLVFCRQHSTLHRPTADWFLHTCLHIWRQEAAGHSSIGDRCWRDVNCLAKFINMCCLYDNEMQAQPSSLRAQVSVLLAVHSVFTDGARGPTSEGAFRAWRLVRSKTCGSNIRDLVLPVFTRICDIVISQCLRLLGQLQGDPQAAIPAEKRYPAAARRIPKEFPLALADELLPIWPESCSTPVM